MTRFAVALIGALFCVQCVNALEYCEGKEDGNYLCYNRTARAVCSCVAGEHCPVGQWYDPTVGDCSWSKDLLTTLIQCLLKPDEFIDPYIASVPHRQDFCELRADGNYPCNSSPSSRLCACYRAEPCAAGEWYDYSKPGCTKLTAVLIRKLIKCVEDKRFSETETTTETPEETTTAVAECPDGYLGPVDGSFCYKAIFEPLAWNQGTRRCKDDHPRAHLAYIQDEEQNDAVVEYLEKFRGKNYCFILGGTSEVYYTSGVRKYSNDCTLDPAQRKDEFVWKINDTTSIQLTDYSNWQDGEPNCYEDRQENCLQYRCDDGTCYWNDYYCMYKACLLCQIDL